MAAGTLQASLPFHPAATGWGWDGHTQADLRGLRRSSCPEPPLLGPGPLAGGAAGDSVGCHSPAHQRPHCHLHKGTRGHPRLCLPLSSALPLGPWLRVRWVPDGHCADEQRRAAPWVLPPPQVPCRAGTAQGFSGSRAHRWPSAAPGGCTGSQQLVFWGEAVSWVASLCPIHLPNQPQRDLARQVSSERLPACPWALGGWSTKLRPSLHPVTHPITSPSPLHGHLIPAHLPGWTVQEG